MCMEIKAITEMLEWVTHQAITRLVCLTGSMSTLVEISTGMLHADWTTAISQSSLSMMSTLNRNSFVDEDFITEEIFERMKMEKGNDWKWLTQNPHPGGQDQEGEIAKKIFDKLFKAYKLDHYEIQAYEVLLSYPNATNQVYLKNGGGDILHNATLLEPEMTMVNDRNETIDIRFFNNFKALFC